MAHVMEIPARNPRAEAEARLGGRVQVRVLEPSPPTVLEPPWFADDPTVPDDRDPSDPRPLVGPTSEADQTWDALCAADGDPGMAAWCAERWLAAQPRLGPVPAGYAETRESLRRLAAYVVAPARRVVNGKIGLRYTAGGFGTPFFGADRQVRVDGSNLVVQAGSSATAEPITSLAAAATAVGVELSGDPGVGHDLPALGDVEEDLAVGAVASVAAWMGFAASVLEELRAELRHQGETSRVQVWPEHFDMAFDHVVDGGHRANFGCSPGDADHLEPYLYVGPFEPHRFVGSFWNAPFGGRLSYGDLIAAPDQQARALAFFQEGVELLET